MQVTAEDDTKAYLNIYGEGLQQTPASIGGVLVEGHLCDGSKFKQTIITSEIDGGYAEMSLINDCSSIVVPTFDAECGSGKTKRSRRL